MDEIEQETEEEEEEKARTSGLVVLNIAYKSNLLLKQTMQNRLNIMLFWETPYRGPAHNNIHHNEHPKIIKSLYVGVKPELKPTQAQFKTNMLSNIMMMMMKMRKT